MLAEADGLLRSLVQVVFYARMTSGLDEREGVFLIKPR